MAEQSGMEMMTFICAGLTIDKERRGAERRQAGRRERSRAGRGLGGCTLRRKKKKTHTKIKALMMGLVA